MITNNPSINPLPPVDDIINALDDLQWFYWLDACKNEIPLFNSTRETLSRLPGYKFILTQAPHAVQWIDHLAFQFRSGDYYARVYPVKWKDKYGVEHPLIRLRTEASINLTMVRFRWYDLINIFLGISVSLPPVFFIGL
ncbi:MAG: hypothetical protein ACFFBD_22990 [Candidatus Hodarchaeota archaeon]